MSEIFLRKVVRLKKHAQIVSTTPEEVLSCW